MLLLKILKVFSLFDRKILQNLLSNLDRMTGAQLLKLVYEEKLRIQARKKQRGVDDSFANKI